MQDADEVEGQDIEFVKEVPPRMHSAVSGGWSNHLMPLLSKPGVWARIWVYDSPEPAYKLQSNMHARKVKIPEPEHEWEFAARGCEVYAIYRGRKRGRASVRRAK